MAPEEEKKKNRARPKIQEQIVDLRARSARPPPHLHRARTHSLPLGAPLPPAPANTISVQM